MLPTLEGPAPTHVGIVDEIFLTYINKTRETLSGSRDNLTFLKIAERFVKVFCRVLIAIFVCKIRRKTV